MRVRMIAGGEQWDGPRYVNDRIHGSKWKPIWIVEVTFDSEQQAMQLADELRRRHDEMKP